MKMHARWNDSEKKYEIFEKKWRNFERGEIGN